jgi:hypothetical protein
MPNSDDFAYLAAMIDGEGSISLYRHRQYKRNDWQYRPRVLVVNTHRGLVDSLQQRFGGSALLQARRPHTKHLYMWRVIGMEDIQRILTGCMPYMIVKRDRASLLLAFVEERLSHRVGRVWNGRYSDIELQIHKQIAVLNARTSHVTSHSV